MEKLLISKMLVAGSNRCGSACCPLPLGALKRVDRAYAHACHCLSVCFQGTSSEAVGNNFCSFCSAHGDVIEHTPRSTMRRRIFASLACCHGSGSGGGMRHPGRPSPHRRLERLAAQRKALMPRCDGVHPVSEPRAHIVLVHAWRFSTSSEVPRAAMPLLETHKSSQQHLSSVTTTQAHPRTNGNAANHPTKNTRQTRPRGFQARRHGRRRPRRRRSPDRVPRPRRGVGVHRELRVPDAAVHARRPAGAVRALLHAARLSAAVRSVCSCRGVSSEFLGPWRSGFSLGWVGIGGKDRESSGTGEGKGERAAGQEDTEEGLVAVLLSSRWIWSAVCFR